MTSNVQPGCRLLWPPWGQKKVAIVERLKQESMYGLLWRGGHWLRFNCDFSRSFTYDSVGVTPRSVGILRSVQAKEKVVHTFPQRIK